MRENGPETRGEELRSRNSPDFVKNIKADRFKKFSKLQVGETQRKRLVGTNMIQPLSTTGEEEPFLPSTLPTRAQYRQGLAPHQKRWGHKVWS